MIEITDQMVESMYHSFDQEVSKEDILTALQSALNPIPLLHEDNHDRVIYYFETFDCDYYHVGILDSDKTELWVVDLVNGPLPYTVSVSEVTTYTNQKMTKRIFRDFDSQWKSIDL